MLLIVALQAHAAASGCSAPNATEYAVDHFNDPLFGDGGLEVSRVAVASVICWLITSVSVAAGIGGGGLLVPLYFIALDLEQTMAVSLSKGTIFGVAVGNFFFLTQEKHPKANRPLIDYPTAIFMQGGELMGVVLGVLLNLLLPEIVTIIMSAVVLSFNAYKTLTKARKKYGAETVAFAKAKAKKITASRADDVKECTPPPSPPDDDPARTSSPPSKAAGPTQISVKADVAVRDKLLAEQARRFPLWAWALLTLMCTFFVFYTLIIGKVFDPTFTNCVPAYWPVYLTPFLFYSGILGITGYRNVHTQKLLISEGIEPIEGDIRWTPKAVAMLIPAAIGAGVAAGLLGIGGGMIIGPIFVALDFHPQVGTATTGFMVLFTALGGTVKYLTVGKLPWRHFLWFAALGALGGQTGQRVVTRIIQRTGRPSYVIFILGGIIALAVVVMTTFGLLRAVEEANCGVDIWAPDPSQFVCQIEDVDDVM